MGDEPAVPILAPIPFHAARSLLNIAERDAPELTKPGRTFEWKVDKRGASFIATLDLYHGKHGDVDFDCIGRVTYKGDWEAGGFIRWTRA